MYNARNKYFKPMKPNAKNPVFLYDTLKKEKREFSPIKEGEVSMYHCGPTVYDYLHIGNLRTFLLADFLRRVFEFNGYKVHQVMNITDIGHLTSDADSGDDKMTKALIREGKELTLENMKQLALFYSDVFKNDLKNLNILTPNSLPMASDHIQEDIDLISLLTKKGFTYKTSDGLYFDTLKYPEYGKLGGISVIDEKELQSRLAQNSEKKDPRDFALWKFNNTLGYEAPWGKGFPGWHIECSAMSMKYLGESFDIYTGGIDHISVHHNNEIAQSESVTGKPLANYWLHGAFLTVKDSKMAKSSGEFITLKSLVEKGYSPLDYRYLLLTAHWSTALNFSFESLDGAKNARQKMLKLISELENGSIDENQINEFTLIVNNNLNMPEGISYLWQLLKANDLSTSTIAEFDKVLGLNLIEEAKKLISSNDDIPMHIQNLATSTTTARANKNWEEADRNKEQLRKLGYEVIDTLNGTEVKKKL